MGCVYSLTLHDRDGGSFFHIGMFGAYAQAEDVAADYCRNVKGFKDYPFEAVIEEVPVVEYKCSTQTVYRWCGWNEDDFGDEVDIVAGDCYLLRTMAVESMERAKIETPREEWALNAYFLGECLWQEGFVREDD